MKLSPLRISDFKRSPWRNGLGWTDQIAISPPGADLRRGNFDWRVSTAHVAQSAPFSPFPEHDRLLIIIDGPGVRLSHTFEEGVDPEVVDLQPGEPYEFPGDVPTRCDLNDGPIRDFSVFVRKGVATAVIEGLELSDESSQLEWVPQSATSFIFVISGAVQLGDITMNAGEALRIDQDSQEDSHPLQLSSRHARFLVVQLETSD